jgi:hypothetical protein
MAETESPVRVASWPMEMVLARLMAGPQKSLDLK